GARHRGGEREGQEPRGPRPVGATGRDGSDGGRQRGGAVKVYNTMSRTKEELVPLTPGHIRMYSCGVTVYDLSHVGHARMMIVFDVISRYLRFSGYRLTFVRNFTDIEDKIIRRANQEGVPASEVSERYVAAFRQDIAALGVLAPEVEPKATEHVPEMIA